MIAYGRLLLHLVLHSVGVFDQYLRGFNMVLVVDMTIHFIPNGRCTQCATRVVYE